MKTRILFVDNNQNALRTIRHIFSDRRDRWEMDFAEDAESCMSAFSDEPYDVTVTADDIAGTSGGDLLGVIRDTYPKTVRLMMTDSRGRTDVERSVDTAHAFVTIPIDRSRFETTVERSLLLRKRLADKELRRAIAGMDTLPVLPETYQALQREVSREDFSLKRIARIIQKDIGIAAGIIKLINSSYFALPRKVTRIEQAVSYLGIQTIKSLILFSNLYNTIDVLPRDIPAVDRMNEHSAKIGRLAKKLYQHFNDLDKQAAEKALIAGMMHDVGKLLLANRKKHISPDELQNDTPVWDMDEAQETLTFGISHAETGAYLLASWLFPDDIVEAVAYHHTPDDALGDAHFSLLTVVHLAEATVTRVETGRKDTFDLDYLTKTGIDISAVATATMLYREIIT